MDKTSLYKRHKIIYTDSVSGKFNKIRLTSMLFIVFMFFLLPWISCNGLQAFLFDLSCTKFYFFGTVFWPQDFFLFAIFCVIAIFTLFFFTVYAGRIWCGFLCPQSIWIKMSVFLSRIIEGNRIKRKKNDLSKLTLNIFKKKIIKHFLWILFSFLTAFTFVGYFVPIFVLYEKVIIFDLRSWSFFWVVFFSILTYFNISWFREQFCFIVCPYSRLQSVMFDENTLIVAYDKKRGEKRGARNKNEDYLKIGLGQCIDCYQCVNCCPTGIDIRDGLQMECIGCAACIDACNNVMSKMRYPSGLIRYMRESSMYDGAKRTNISIIRLMSYFLFLMFLVFLFVYLLNVRSLTQFNVNRSQNQLYNITKNNIENFYILKITNKTSNKNVYKISVLNSDLKYVGIRSIILNGEETLVLDVKLVLDGKTDLSKRFYDVIFKVEWIDSKRSAFILKKSKFIVPKND